MHISVVIPIFKCSAFILELNERLVKTIEKITNAYEIIYINDASPEEDWKLILDMSLKDKNIKGINLSRNFGQHYAISAGLNYAKGEWVIVMDGDLQDQPEEISTLYNKAVEGFDIVLAQRKKRKDRLFKKMFSKLYYRIFNYLTDTKQDHTVANYGIYSQKVIKSILEMKDYIRYFPSMVQWVGFKKIKIEIKHSKRSDKKSSYTLKSLFRLAINNIIAFSDKPLRLVVNFGFFIILISLIVSIVFIIKYFMGETLLTGYPSLIISLWFLSGVIIFILGIVGLYIGKTFEKVKDRPTYIISEKLNL